MAQARRFKVTLKDSPTAPATYKRGAYDFKRGTSIEITNIADADYFDACEEFQVVELTGATAEKPAAPKGRFSRMAAPAPSAEEDEGEEELEDESEDGDEEEAEVAAPNAELEQALAPKKGKGGRGKAKKAG
jgi:hypothetical protein